MITQQELEKLTDDELWKLCDMIKEECYDRIVTIPDILKKILEAGENLDE